jgi:cyclic dehypoxanthinyl futalosine synthase
LAFWPIHVRQKVNPGRVVTYIAGRNINYTNACWVQCKFCAFYRLPGKDGAYTLPKEEVFQKVQEMVDLGGIEILLQGGLNPKLRIEYYEDLFSSITDKFPQVWLHALSVAEILYIAKISRISLQECLTRLRDAGLKTIPGAGAEMLVDRVRKVIAPYKDTTDEWLGTMRLWHELGGHSTVTMMYGTGRDSRRAPRTHLRVRDDKITACRALRAGYTAVSRGTFSRMARHWVTSSWAAPRNRLVRLICCKFQGRPWRDI